MRLLRRYVVIVTLLACSVANAMPTISSVEGIVTYGENLTIRGNGFGNHNLETAFSGYKIEALPNGNVGDWGNWRFTQTGSDPNPQIVSDIYHSGSKSIYVNIPGMHGSIFSYEYPGTIGYDQDLFVSWWVRRHRTGSGKYQWKLFRVGYSPNSLYDDYTPQFKWFEHDGQYNEFFIDPGPGTSCSNGGPPYPEDYLQTSFPSKDDRWYRIDIYMHTSSGEGIADGRYIHRVYDPAAKVIKERSSNGWVTFNTGDHDFYKYFFWQNWMETSSITHELWFDDFYIQVGTRARVELCDSQDWNNRTTCDIQVPDSWSDSEITIKSNPGGFPEGSTAYLFVVDKDGNVSNGYPVTIGGGGTPADNPPSVSITGPTGGDTYSTSEGTVAISGNASDDNGISSISWSNNRGGSGSATNTSGDWSGWSISGISLQEGENVITVTATDTNNQTATDTITITYTPNDMVQAWSATQQTGDAQWKDSTVTYCARLLIENEQISSYGNQIILAFKGRSSGDYTIRKVSIAERDPNGGEGDVVDSTWTKVTFDGKDESTWDTDIITVPAGQEKLSDPVNFTLEPGKDYYVTFKIVTPSVYLNPPSTYRELYFWSDDHTSDVDWSSNGHDTTQDYHAFSKIYVVGGTDDTTPPGDVTNLQAVPGPAKVTFSWTNPTDSDFAGVMIRYKTDGTYPQDTNDGYAVPNGNNGKITGNPGQDMS